jgi:hypothetical protein
MSWNFETEPAFQHKLDWIAQFVRDEVEPLEFVLGNHYDVKNPDAYSSEYRQLFQSKPDHSFGSKTGHCSDPNPTSHSSPNPTTLSGWVASRPVATIICDRRRLGN